MRTLIFFYQLVTVRKINPIHHQDGKVNKQSNSCRGSRLIDERTATTRTKKVRERFEAACALPPRRATGE
jgi:hypothetical protein